MSDPVIFSTATASLNMGIKGMIYGPSGVGKTRLLASAPRPFILSGEHGLLSLRGFNLPATVINSVASLEAAYHYVAGPKGKQFDTVCLDSISEFAETILAERKTQNKDPRKAYGDMQEIVTMAVKLFRDLPNKHVIFVAKQQRSKDGLTGAMYNEPAFPGQQLDQLAPYWFDIVAQIQNFPGEQPGQIIRALRTSPDAQNVAKDRSGALAMWENADPATGGGLTALFAKMLAKPAA